MPAKLDRCVKHVQEQGKDQSSAFAICTASLKKKKIKLDKEKIKKKMLHESVMVGSTPIIGMVQTGPILQDIYPLTKHYKPVKNKK